MRILQPAPSTRPFPALPFRAANLQTSQPHLLPSSDQVNLQKPTAILFSGKPSRKEKELIAAAERGDLPEVQKLISQGVKIAAINSYKETPLHKAVANGHLKTIQWLASQPNIKLDCKDTDGKTPLDLAYYGRRQELAQWLEEAYPKALQTVRLAVQQGDSNKVYAFINGKYYIPNLIQGRQSLAMLAAGYGQLDVLRLLINRGANLKLEDAQGYTALSKSAQAGQLETLAELLAHGAPVTPEDMRLLLARITHPLAQPLKLETTGMSALSRAAAEGNLARVRELASQNPVLLNQPDAQGLTPLMQAAKYGQVATARLLLDYGAEVNWKVGKVGQSETALSKAARQGQSKVIAFLLTRDATVTPADMQLLLARLKMIPPSRFIRTVKTLEPVGWAGLLAAGYRQGGWAAVATAGALAGARYFFQGSGSDEAPRHRLQVVGHQPEPASQPEKNSTKPEKSKKVDETTAKEGSKPASMAVSSSNTTAEEHTTPLEPKTDSLASSAPSASSDTDSNLLLPVPQEPVRPLVPVKHEPLALPSASKPTKQTAAETEPTGGTAAQQAAYKILQLLSDEKSLSTVKQSLSFQAAQIVSQELRQAIERKPDDKEGIFASLQKQYWEGLPYEGEPDTDREIRLFCNLVAQQLFGKTIPEIEDKSEKGFNSVIGMDEHKETLKDEVVVPLNRFQQEALLESLPASSRRRQRFEAQAQNQPFGGVLLYGESGTGKTWLAEKLAQELDMRAIRVSRADIVSARFGDSEKNLQKAFAQAAKQRPSVLIIDNIESMLYPLQALNTSSHERNLTNQTLHELEKAGQQGVLVVGTTNHIKSIEPAALDRPSRFALQMEVKKPETIVRKHFFKHYLTQLMQPLPLPYTEEELQQLAESSEGLHADEIEELCKQADIKAERVGLDEPSIPILLQEILSMKAKPYQK